MIPSILLLITYFRVVSLDGPLQHADRRWCSPTRRFVLPFTTWLLKGTSTAIADRAGRGGADRRLLPLSGFVRVILPVACRADHAATSIYAFLLAWNEFIFAYVLTDSSEKYTISVGIAHLFGEYSVAWNELMAAGLVAAVPPIVLYLFTSASWCPASPPGR